PGGAGRRADRRGRRERPDRGPRGDRAPAARGPGPRDRRRRRGGCPGPLPRRPTARLSAGTQEEDMSDTTVLVLVDHRDGMVGAPAPELLTAARALGAPEAVRLGPHAPDETTAAELARHGAGVVHHVALDAAAAHRPEVVAAALGGLAEAAGDVTVLLASSFPAKEAAARLAWHLGAALMVDVAGL